MFQDMLLFKISNYYIYKILQINYKKVKEYSANLMLSEYYGRFVTIDNYKRVIGCMRY